MFRLEKKNCGYRLVRGAANFCALAIRRFAPNPGIRGAVSGYGTDAQGELGAVFGKRLDQLDTNLQRRRHGGKGRGTVFGSRAGDK